MNSFTGMGRLAADPELRRTGSGLFVTSFAIAIDRRDNGKNKATDWIDVVAYRSTAEFICKYFKKGSPIIVEGSLQTRLWEDRTGQKRKAVEVIANSVEFVLSSRREGQAEPTEQAEPEQTAPEQQEFFPVDGEDLPF